MQMHPDGLPTPVISMVWLKKGMNMKWLLAQSGEARRAAKDSRWGGRKCMREPFSKTGHIRAIHPTGR
jgi:hypothetical protein